MGMLLVGRPNFLSAFSFKHQLGAPIGSTPSGFLSTSTLLRLEVIGFDLKRSTVGSIRLWNKRQSLNKQIKLILCFDVLMRN